MASAHERSTPSTQHLCELLVRRIETELPGIQSHQAANWCSIGKPTFAYVSHQRDSPTVFLRCGEADGDRLASLIDPPHALALEKRDNLGSAWARITPYSVRIRAEADAIAATPLFVVVFLAVAKGPSRASRQRVSAWPSEDYAGETFEGARATLYVNRYERDPKARKACISIYGAVCAVCNFDFGKAYGEIGAGFIHVHHLKPLSGIGTAHKVNPRTDLRPVCPNCHEMLHRRAPPSPPFSIDELRSRLTRASRI